MAASRSPEAASAAAAAVVYKLAHGDVEYGDGSEERVGRSGHVRVNTHDGRDVTSSTARLPPFGRPVRKRDAKRTRDTRARTRPDRARVQSAAAAERTDLVLVNPMTHPLAVG